MSGRTGGSPSYWKRPGMDRYQFRNAILSHLGYKPPHYVSYLASDDWKAIRAAVVSRWPKCVMCESPTEVVHHLQYDIGTLLGLHYTKLAPLCHACHELVEFEENEKNDVLAACRKCIEASLLNDYGTSWKLECDKEWSTKCQENDLGRRIRGAEREIRELLNSRNPAKILARRYATLTPFGRQAGSGT